MDSQAKLQQLLERMRSVRDEVEAEIERLLEVQRQQFRYHQERGRIVFDRQVEKLHRRARIGSLRYLLGARFATLITAPIIYGMALPIAALDVSISIYQHICFRVYKIPRVRRADYIVIDRHRLPYLNTVQKLNCVYCGYGNGVMAYAREVVARTEQYWCPIKHAQRAKGVHEREAKFFDYGDAEAWRNQLQVIRCDWDEKQDCS